MGLASSADSAKFEWALDHKAPPIFRAAVWVARTWEWDLAVDLDKDGHLVPAVAEAAAELFAALGEVEAEGLVREAMNRSQA
jgi:hypothetical protein